MRMHRYWVVAEFAAHVELVRSGSAFGSESPHHALMGRSGLLEARPSPWEKSPVHENRRCVRRSSLSRPRLGSVMGRLRRQHRRWSQ